MEDYKNVISKLNKLIAAKNFVKALDICNNPIYDNDVKIQLQKMELYYILQRYNEALDIGKRPEFANVVSIQLKLVQVYMALKEYDKAMEICMKEEFAELGGFAQLKKRVKKELFKINGTQVKVTSNDFADYFEKVDNLIKLAKKDKNPGRARNIYRKALGYCTHEAFVDNLDAIIYRVKLLKLLGEYDQALEIVSRPEYQDNSEMFLQRVSILYHFKRYDEVLLLIDKSEFKNSMPVMNIRKNISVKRDETVNTNSLELANDIDLRTKLISNVLNSIKSKAITFEEIESLEIDSFSKEILYVAYYEAFGYSADFIKKTLKEMMIFYQDNQDYMNIINKMAVNFVNRTKLFNIKSYERLLNSINTNELSSIKANNR